MLSDVYKTESLHIDLNKISANATAFDLTMLNYMYPAR